MNIDDINLWQCENQFDPEQLITCIYHINEFFKEFDIELNHKIAIISRNNIYMALLYYTITEMGYVFVPINYNYPNDLIKELILENDIDIIIYEEKFENKITKSIRNLLSFKLENIKDLVDNINFVKNYNILTRRNQAKFSTIIFTSGSSFQKPKGVVHHLDHHLNSALNSSKNIKFEYGDRWLLTLPLYHIGGLAILNRMTLNHAGAVFPDENLSLINNIEKYKITHISLVASQFSELLSKKENVKILSKLKVILLGGSAIPDPLIELAYKNKLKILTSYGSTEMGSQICTSEPSATLEQLKKSGKILDQTEIMIDENSEILVRGNSLFYCYYDKEKINKFDKPVIGMKKDWFKTNDRGVIDSDGYLRVLGRIDNMIISGGENIQPEEIEKVINSYIGIESNLVIPIEDDKWGQRPVAFIKTKINFNETKFLDYLKNNLPKYSVPDIYINWSTEKNKLGFKVNRAFFKDLLKSNDYEVLFTKNQT